MSAMTTHPKSPIPAGFNIPANGLPHLCDASPPTFKVGVAGLSVVKCYNVAFGSRFQIGGVDSTAATWVSPFTLAINYTPGAPGIVECQAISPEGRLSNKIKFFCVP